MEVSSSNRGLVVIAGTPRSGWSCTNIQSPGSFARCTEVPGSQFRRPLRKQGLRTSLALRWLDRRGRHAQRYGDCLKVVARFLASAGSVLLKHFAAMVVEEVALLRAELADVEWQLDVPVVQNHGVQLLRHQQLAVVRKRDVSALKKVSNVRRKQQAVGAIQL